MNDSLRPAYQTQEDLDNEESVAKILEKLWGYRVEKLRRYDKIDRALVPPMTEHPVAFAEIKCRTNEKWQYTTYLISLEKLQEAHIRYAVTGIPVHFVVRWTDEIGYYTVDKPMLDKRVTLGVAGREDRGDPNDREMCGFIPIDLFETVKPREGRITAGEPLEGSSE